MSARLTLTAALAVLALVGGSAPSAGEVTADLVLHHGRFYPVSRPGFVDGALAVRDGRIMYLGPDAGAAGIVGPETRVVDLGGATVTPGLVDAHSHLSGLGAFLGEVDLKGTASYDEVVARVVAGAAAAPAGTWVRGRGWDQNDWSDKEFPSHGPLSRAVADRPVWLERIDGHAVLVNARALELLGITASTADVPGGRIFRDAAGEATGVLIDESVDQFKDLLPAAPVEEVRRRLATAARHCLERGLTTVTEIGAGATVYEAYAGLRDGDELPLRVAMYLSDNRALITDWLARGPRLDDEARFTVRGIKLYADGALGSRGAALIEPYSDDPGNSGLIITGTDEILEVCRLARDAGFQLIIHAIGDRGSLVALDGLEACLGRGGAAKRFRLEHAQVMRLQDIARLARLGIIASVQPTHATSDMPWAEDRVGPRRIEGAYAWRRLVDAGAVLALGSDFPVESADPLHGFYAAVTRQDPAGNPAGGWRPGERLTRAEALRGFTLDAAYSIFLEGEIGSLDVGKRADLTVFDIDIMRVPPEQILDARVEMTFVDGELVHRRED